MVHNCTSSTIYCSAFKSKIAIFTAKGLANCTRNEKYRINFHHSTDPPTILAMNNLLFSRAMDSCLLCTVTKKDVKVEFTLEEDYKITWSKRRSKIRVTWSIFLLDVPVSRTFVTLETNTDAGGIFEETKNLGFNACSKFTLNGQMSTKWSVSRNKYVENKLNRKCDSLSKRPTWTLREIINRECGFTWNSLTGIWARKKYETVVSYRTIFDVPSRLK